MLVSRNISDENKNIGNMLVVKFLCLFIFGTLVAFIPDMTFASNQAGISDTIGTALCEIAGAVTGSVGSGLGTIAVLTLGIGAFFGKVSWALAVQIGVGIAVVFGAAEIVTVLAVVNTSGGCGGGGGCACGGCGSHVHCVGDPCGATCLGGCCG